MNTELAPNIRLGQNVDVRIGTIVSNGTVGQSELNRENEPDDCLHNQIFDLLNHIRHVQIPFFQVRPQRFQTPGMLRP